jgi:hypothetical protein
MRVQRERNLDPTSVRNRQWLIQTYIKGKISLTPSGVWKRIEPLTYSLDKYAKHRLINPPAEGQSVAVQGMTSSAYTPISEVKGRSN